MERIYNENEIRYEKARKRVHAIKGFYGNLSSYVLVNLFLLILNLVTSPEHLWFYWPMLGWGLGVVFHGLKVFNFQLLGKDWEQRKMREFMEQEAINNKKYE